MIAAGILAKRIIEDAIMKHHDKQRMVKLWVMLFERRKENADNE